jgi:tyrosine-protein kinase Etk/Wzc
MVPKGQVLEANVEYLRRLRDVKCKETDFDILIRQFEAAKLDEAKQGVFIHVVDTALRLTKNHLPNEF